MDDCSDEPTVKIENDWDYEYYQHIAPEQINTSLDIKPNISNNKAGPDDISDSIKDEDYKAPKCITDNDALTQCIKHEADQTESESNTYDLHDHTSDETENESCQVLSQKKRHKKKSSVRGENETGKSHSSNKKSYKCDICLKVFARRSSLTNHRITHTGETPFTCPFCQKGFNVRSNLNVHLRIHTGQKPHLCEICDKSFTQAGQLKQHLRIHKGEKPYTCSTCQRCFRNTSGLKTHQRTHTGEKPFPCDLCTRSFSTSTSLKTHRVTHTGTMLFDCPVCGRQFNRRNNLNVHIKRHDKNRSFPCPICSSGFVMRAHLRFHLQRCHEVDVKADSRYHDLLDKNCAQNERQDPFIEIVNDLKSEPEEITTKVDHFKSELT